jgi:hypothetical protein
LNQRESTCATAETPPVVTYYGSNHSRISPVE